MGSGDGTYLMRLSSLQSQLRVKGTISLWFFNWGYKRAAKSQSQGRQAGCLTMEGSERVKVSSLGDSHKAMFISKPTLK